jgi:hypothetical protein
VATLLQRYGISPAVIGLTTGDKFPDALSGGAALGAMGGVMVLTPARVLHDSARSTLDALKAISQDLVIFGGTATISSNTEAAVHHLLGDNQLFDQLLQGDFSVIAGAWLNAKGESVRFDANGFEGGSPDIYQYFNLAADGSYSIGVGSGPGSFAIMIYPIGVSVPACGSDTSQIRIHMGHAGASSNDVYYRMPAYVQLPINSPEKAILRLRQHLDTGDRDTTQYQYLSSRTDSKGSFYEVNTRGRLGDNPSALLATFKIYWDGSVSG